MRYPGRDLDERFGHELQKRNLWGVYLVVGTGWLALAGYDAVRGADAFAVIWRLAFGALWMFMAGVRLGASGVPPRVAKWFGISSEA